MDSFPIIEPSKVTIFADWWSFMLIKIGELDFLYRFWLAYKYLLNDGTTSISKFPLADGKTWLF